MNKLLAQYKGIHPGIVLIRELEKRGIKQRPFALSIGEHPQTFNAIIKGKRSVNAAISLKIENALAMEEGTLLILQAYHDIAVEKEKRTFNKPNLSILRLSLFWDTDVCKIDWENQYKAVIKRVFDRGNEQEKQEIIRFYGQGKLLAALNAPKTEPINLQKEPAKQNALL